MEVQKAECCFINIGVLITLAFLLKLDYTYIFRRFRGFERISARGRSAALAGLFVFGGWFHRHQVLPQKNCR